MVTGEPLDKLLKDRIKLTGILNYHLLPAKLMADDLQPGQIQTVQGAMLKVGTIDGAPTVIAAMSWRAGSSTSSTTGRRP